MLTRVRLVLIRELRDLGTEGAEDADISLRKCLSGPDPLIPGPRYFTANRAIVSTGSYGLFSQTHACYLVDLNQ